MKTYMRKLQRMIAGMLVGVLLCGLIPVTARAAVPTQAEALAWIRSQVGKGLDMDGAYGNQCVDLILAYYDFLGVPRSSGNAVDYTWNTLPNGFLRLQGAAPQPGDILVYSNHDGNPYGHVAIYESDRVHYHQNFNSHPYVEKVTYMYNGLTSPYWGVIRPNFGGQTAVVTMDWINDDCQPDSSNVYVYTRAQAGTSGTFTEAGVTIWNAAGEQVAHTIEYISTPSSYLNVWYNITNDTGVVLTSGSYYKYQFFTKFNGNTYYGPVKEFWTTGNPPEKPLPFTDVSANEWYYDAVKYVYKNNCMTGTSDTTFAPETHIPRAQFASILYRLNNAPDVSFESRFSDVYQSDWYADAVIWAYQQRIVNGYENGSFGPNNKINREQMAVMLYGYAASKGYDTTQRADFSKYKDAYNVSDYAQEAMRWAVANKVITGKNSGTMLDPWGYASRAESAAIIMNFIEKFGK